jgi:(2Fe-2S) ferredoxin
MPIRLEDTGTGLFEVLDEMRRGGALAIRIQPIGLPFPESLLAWLPGVLADWRSRPVNGDIAVSLGPDPTRAGAGSAAMLNRVLTFHASSVKTVKPSLGKPGWENPPDFDFHLLVCTGPRCHMRDAASLSHVLKAECAEAGIAGRCLTTTTGCIYPCNKGPVVVVYPQGDWFHIPDCEAARRLVRQVLCDGETLPDLHFHTTRRARVDH